MKKSLIAVAALAATSAFAQSSVSIYGVADVWLGSSQIKASANGQSESVRNSLLGDGGVSSSRIGFKGTEDLGGGLKANFVLEQGFNMTTGAQTAPGTAFGREASVGLSGAFGAVQAGKTWTAYDDVRGANNDTFNANIASSYNTWVGYEDNPNSTIKYTSPNFNGFTGSLSYSLGGDKTATNSASSIFSLGGQYANGPVSVGVAHQQQKQTGGLNDVFSAVPGVLNAAELAYPVEVGALKAALTPSAAGKTTYTLINGSYDFGVAKLIAGYNVAKQTVNGVDASLKANEFNLGVEVPVAANLNLGLGYAQSKLKEDGQTVAKSTGFSAALVYSLSKRTAAYAALTQSKFKLEGADLELKSNLYAVGVKHTF